MSTLIEGSKVHERSKMPTAAQRIASYDEERRAGSKNFLTISMEAKCLRSKERVRVHGRPS